MPARPTVSAVVAAVVVLTTVVPCAAQTALDERRQHVATITSGEIGRLTGAAARNCGIFPLTAGIDSPPPVGRDDVTTALRCVQAAQRRGEAAWVIWQVSGVDAIVFDGLAASASSAVHLVHGLGSNARIRLSPCLKPRVDKDAAISCANAGRTMSDDDVAEAMTRLARDVSRTAGFELADLVPAPAASAPGDGTRSSPELAMQQAVEAAQRAVHAAGEPQWPRCPHHFDHPLSHRDGWWFCERDRAFIAELGRVSTRVPRVKKRR